MQVQAAISCILLACIAAASATDTAEGPARPKRDLALLKSIASKLLHITVPKLPLPIRDEVVPFPPPFGGRIVNLRAPILDDPDCHKPVKFTRLRPPFSMVRLPPPPPFLLPVNPSPMEFVPRSMQIYPPPPPLPVPPPVRVLPPPMTILPPPGCELPHPHPMPIPRPPKIIVPPPPKPILPLRKVIIPPPAMPILPPPKTILPPPPLPVLPLPSRPSVPVFPLPLPPIVTEPILPSMPIPLPGPIELPKPIPIPIPSFKYLYNQRNDDGSVTTTYSKDGKDVLVTITDDKLRIPAGVIVDRVEKIVTGAPFLPIISGPEPIIPVPIRDYPVPMRPSLFQDIIAPRPLDLGGQWMPPAIEITKKSIVNGEPPHYGGLRLPIINEIGYPADSAGDREDAVSVTTRKISSVPPPPFARLPSSPFYTYKQINSEMSEPIAVVNVETPVPFGPGLPFPSGADVSILNRHEHVRPDGTRYTCFEKHLPVRVNPLEPMTEFPGPTGFPIMQPMLPLEVDASKTIDRGSIKFSDTSSSIEPSKSAESFKMLPLLPLPTLPEKQSLSKNPIVVLGNDSENTFSYKVNKMDGSSLDVKADKDNKVSVKINNFERRGDIPVQFL